MKKKTNDITFGCESVDEKWFILAHCFNMDGRAASQTITDRLPFLVEKGKIPVCLSAPTGFKDTRFPHYQIISFAPSGVRFELRHIINKKFNNAFIQNVLKIFFAILLFPFYLIEKLFIHLDSQWSWFLGAVPYGYYIIKKHRPSLIYSTAGPPSTHLTGFLLHKATRLPWLVELHDPLIYENQRFKWQNYYFKKWLEKTICRHASRIIFFTHKALDNANKRCNLRGKGVVIRPGAFPPNFRIIDHKKGNRIHFSHFGSLGGDRNLVVIIEAIHELIDENPAWQNLIKLDIYGSDLDSVSQKYLSLFPLNDIIHLHGRLEFDPITQKSGRQRIIELMQQTDVLMLIHDGGATAKEYIPSKVYEYFLANRPILGLVAKDCELEQILLETGHYTVETTDIQQVKKTMISIIITWQKGGLENYSGKSPFTIQKTVEKLLEIAAQIKLRV